MFRRGSSGAVSSMLLYTGSVNKWVKGKPFGFLKDADDGSTFFCHIDDVEMDRAISRGGDRVVNLPEGLEVDFDTAVVEGRTKAVNVTLFGGGRVTAQSITAITGEAPVGTPRREDRRDDRRSDDRRVDDRRGDDRRDNRRDDRRRDFDRHDDRSDDRMWQGKLKTVLGGLRRLENASGEQRTQTLNEFRYVCGIATSLGIELPADPVVTQDLMKVQFEQLNIEQAASRLKAREEREERKQEALSTKAASSSPSASNADDADDAALDDEAPRRRSSGDKKKQASVLDQEDDLF